MDEQAEISSNVTEFTVSEISGAVKRMIEDSFGRVRVRGEISGYRGPHSSGHAYFRLKDDRAAMEAVIWKGVFSKLAFKPEEGMEVIATGKMTTFPGSSKYQIMIDALEPAGAGALMALLEARKKKLAAEGLFDDSRKRALPFMPRHIGVITSPTGAVIRDILHRIQDRFPLHVSVWPVRVQGETTPQEVSAAIDGFNKMADKPDLLIVARGGGSLEDLWGFNDEMIVRAAANSAIPLISAVGHETDWTLLDYVADQRTPTPTGAAEMAVPVKADLEANIASLRARLMAATSRNLAMRRQFLTSAIRALPSSDTLFALPRRRFDEATEGLARGLTQNVRQKRQRFAGLRLSETSIQRRVEHHLRGLEGMGQRLRRAPTRQRLALTDRLSRTSTRLRPDTITRQISLGMRNLTALSRRSDTAHETRLTAAQSRLGNASRLLTTLSYQSVLSRGFALVMAEDGTLIKDGTSAKAAGQIMLEFSGQDRVAAIVTGHADGPKKQAPAKAQSATSGKSSVKNQGSLFD